jgi:hypothetical protein
MNQYTIRLILDMIDFEIVDHFVRYVFLSVTLFEIEYVRDSKGKKCQVNKSVKTDELVTSEVHEQVMMKKWHK